MTYWLNIHDPEPIGHDNDYKVFLKKSHENTARHWIKDQDIAIIYEIGWREGDTVLGSNGRPIPLKEGRKGIVAIVKVGNFYEKRYEYNGDNYLGWYEIREYLIKNDSTPLINLKQLNDLWRSNFEKWFSPRINGGLRIMKSREWEIIQSTLEL